LAHEDIRTRGGWFYPTPFFMECRAEHNAKKGRRGRGEYLQAIRRNGYMLFELVESREGSGEWIEHGVSVTLSFE